MEIKEFFKITKENLPSMTDSEEKEEKVQQIVERIEIAVNEGKKEIKITDKENKILEELNDDAKCVKKISAHAINFSNKLQERTSMGFLVVLIMYAIAFAVGIVLIAFSLHFAGSSKDPNNYLTTFFGVTGVADLGYLLYVPAKKIQESRRNASQLLASFMEWQFVSIWSGKLFGKIYNDFNSCSDKDAAFEKMTSILRLKVELTKELVNTMKSSSDEENSVDESKTKVDTAKMLENDKKNLSKATGTAVDKLDYSGWKIIKQQKEFALGEDKGEGPAKQFWASKHVDIELKKEPSEEEIKKECEKTPKPEEPKKQCSDGSGVEKRWTQWSLFKHEKDEKWKLRCYHNIQWKCIKKPSQVAAKDD